MARNGTKRRSVARYTNPANSAQRGRGKSVVWNAAKNTVRKARGLAYNR